MGVKDHVIETKDLTKKYGPRIVAADSVNLKVPRGEVYGFLGPNGAGKTTTLRMLLGLIHPTSGEASVLGYPPGDPKGLSGVGALVESPAFYPQLSGWRNLRVMAHYVGVPKERIEPALEQVELADRAGDKFKTYSQGMKQRLGVAAALLKEPELLILDEPTNGLDPQGMADMRDLIRQLGRGERTVLLSSHLMGEIEQICDRIGVIRNGRMVAEGPMEELRGGTRLLVRADPMDKARRLAEEMYGEGQVQVFDGALLLAAGSDKAGDITRKLVTSDVEVSELRLVERSLEETFLELTGTER